MIKKEHNTWAALLLLLVAATSRLIPHIPNFTPTEGVALFGAAYLSRKYLAYILPVVMLYATDLILNNTINRSFFTQYDGFVWYSNYMIYVSGAVLLMVILGSATLKKITAGRVLGTAFMASVIFYIISNFGVWLHSTVYTKDMAGLTQCYLAAWPFFRTSVVSNLFFTGLIFGAYELFKYALTRAEKAKSRI
jgi:hypothetical protein